MLPAGGSAQLVSIGVKGGVPITEPQRFNDESRRYLVGPSIEFRLPLHFAVEVDALYSRVGRSYNYFFTYNVVPPGVGDAVITTGSASVRERGNSWEFPILGKYYFGKTESTIRPFLGTGYAFREIWSSQETKVSIPSSVPLNLITTTSKQDFRSPFDVGAVFAAGVRARAGRLSILPEFRYVRWGSASTTQRKNEVKFLLGVSF